MMDKKIALQILQYMNKKETEHRIDCAKRSFAQHRRLLHNQNININTRIMFLNDLSYQNNFMNAIHVIKLVQKYLNRQVYATIFAGQ